MTIPCRGTIVKTPDATPGLLMINGRQKPFVIESMWKSSVAPAVNMAVDAEIDGTGSITSLTAVDQQQLAAERAKQLGDAAQRHGKEAAEIARRGVGALAARMGTATLGAAVIVWIAWFFMPALAIGDGVSGASKSFTFWDLIGLDPNTNIVTTPASHGAFALLGLLAIVAPFVSPFIRNSKAKFLYVAPLAFVVVACFVIQSDLNAFFAHIFGATIADAEHFLSFSFGYGAYLLAAACLFLAVQVLRHPGYQQASSVPSLSTSAPLSPDAAFCTKCAKPLEDGEDFCTRCGTRRAATSGN